MATLSQLSLFFVSHGQINPETLMKLEMQYLGPYAQPLPNNLAFVPANLFKGMCTCVLPSSPITFPHLVWFLSVSILARINLLKLLQTSPHYDPDAILKQIQPTYLSEEKILVYKRLKMHEEALMIIIDVFNDCDRAEKYCIEDATFAANSKPSGVISIGCCFPLSVSLFLDILLRLAYLFRLRMGCGYERKSDAVLLF